MEAFRSRENPFTGYEYPPFFNWNDIIFGVVVFLLARARVVFSNGATALSWINAVIGLWLIGVPFIFGFANQPTPLWNHIVSSALVAALGT